MKRRPKRKTRVKAKRAPRTKKKINLKVLVISISILVIFSYGVYFLLNIISIRTKDPAADNVSRHKILWQQEDNLDSTIFVLERDKEEKRNISDVFVYFENDRKGISLLIYLPGSLYFNGLEEEFGSPISISSLRYAGDFLQEDRGIEYAIWQLAQILGFKVDNYVWITTEGYDVLTEAYGPVGIISERDREHYISQMKSDPSDSAFRLQVLSRNISNISTFFNVADLTEIDGQIYSNLSFPSVLQKLNSYKKSVEQTETYIMDISRSDFSKEEFSDSGGIITSINIPEYDRVYRGYLGKLLDVELERERVRVEVYNASGLTGRANTFSRKILNSGCDVVRFGTAPVNQEKTQVYISDKNEFKNSFNIVSEVLLGRFEEIDERPLFMTTGDIVVILGEDISQLDIF